MDDKGLLGTAQVGAVKVGEFLNKNSPTIFTAFAVGGVFSVVATAISDTERANDQLKEHIFIAGGEKATIKYTRLERLRMTWKCYIPTAVMTAMTIGCIIASHSIHERRTAVLASLYGVADTTLKEYQKKVVEKIGEKKETEIQDAIAKDHIKEQPLKDAVILMSGRGDTLFLDGLSKRYFRYDINKLRQFQNEFNEKLLTNMSNYQTVNEWYNLIGLPGIDLGWDQGWYADGGMLKLLFSPHMGENEEPCLYVKYQVAPVPLTR